jgi:hypothetical protein
VTDLLQWEQVSLPCTSGEEHRLQVFC